MYKHIHFISGLPRSGSTLLAGILRQNPRFYANMSGPICPLMYDMLGQMSGQNDFYVFISDEQRKRILKGIVDNYYLGHTDAEVIFDTNRMWCSNLSMLKTLFPESRIIACVRDIPWIIDSLENLVHTNAVRPSFIFKYDTFGTIYSRVESVLAGNGFLGGPFSALKEACFGPHAQSILLLQYETLVTNPEKALKAIYDFVGESFYCHDFDNVYLDNDEFDLRVGTSGLHRVRSKVRHIKRGTILPPDIFKRLEGESFWRDENLDSPRFSIV